MSEKINVALTLEQLEVIADALEFTGQCIEEEINDTAEGSVERQELVADLEEITTTLEVVAVAMDALVGEE
jgi:acid stress-induced BolA-like protein IbaG/YrbA